MWKSTQLTRRRFLGLAVAATGSTLIARHAPAQALVPMEALQAGSPSPGATTPPLYSQNDIEIFAEGIPHPEGIAFGSNGWIYTGSSRGHWQTGTGPICRISPDGNTVEIFADTGGLARGLAFDRHGNLYACHRYPSQVLRIAPDGSVHVFADSCGSRKFAWPNFLVFDDKGWLYVSDSGDTTTCGPTGAVYRFSPDGEGQIFLDGVTFANGLALAADGNALYVVETCIHRVLRVPILRNGKAGQPEVFADGLDAIPDGLAFDDVGNLYVTLFGTNRIIRIAPNGAQSLLVKDSSYKRLYAPSNLAFGPPDNHGLYIANVVGTFISRLVIDQAGMPLYSQR